MITGERAISDGAVQARSSRENGLDKPLYVQYWRYLSDLVQGDLGESYQKNRPVTDILFDKFPNTFKLAVAAIIIEIIFGIAAGIMSAVKRYSFWDVLVTFSTSVLVAVPVFWLGMLLQILFGIKFKQWGLPYLPISGMTCREFPTWCISSCRRSLWLRSRQPTRRASCVASCSRSWARTTSDGGRKGSDRASGDLEARA